MTFAGNEYDAFTLGVGYADVSDWTEIEIAGADRLKFLNNYCTADLLRLSPNTGAEAFLCNVKGKVLGHGIVYCGNDVLVVETVPGQASTLIAHLDRYVLRDDVTLRDITGQYGLLVIGGDKAEGVLQSLADAPLPAAPYAFVECKLGDSDCAIARGSMLGPRTFSLCTALESQPRIGERLRAAGAIECGRDVLETCRIEAGMPFYGRDITAENLPQEANRNAQAISFTKGCYLGQETVARIDALGHVNRLLVGVQFFGEHVPEPGAELTVDGTSVGHITSATFSPRLATPIALAYVRAAYSAQGSCLDSTVGNACVISFPVAGNAD